MYALDTYTNLNRSTTSPGTTVRPTWPIWPPGPTRPLYPKSVIATIARSIAAGLDGLHTWSNPTVPQANLAHGSLTPAAVVIGFDGVVRIAQLRLGQIAGTSSRIARRPDDPYAAPEVRSGVGLDARTDLHALGLLLAELLTARSPPSNDPDDLRTHDHARRTPPALISLTAQLLNRSPAGRPQSATGVLAKLDEILDGIGGPVNLKEALAPHFIHVRPVVDLPGDTPRQVPAPPEERHMIYVPRSRLVVPALVFLMACLIFGFLFAMFLSR